MTVVLPRAAPSSGAGWYEDGPGAGAPLLVALGGMPVHPGDAPSYSFRRTARRCGAHAVFLRDHAESWYLRGARDAAPDLAGLAGWLSAQRERLAPVRTVIVGNSSGAYAALALGALLDADEVLAFVPRSALSDEVNARLGDTRCAEQRARRPATAYDDLVPLLEREHARRLPRPYRTRFRVCVALDNALDRAHAERLTGLPELVVSAYPRGDHQLAAVLRASGELDALVGAALAG